MIYTLEVADDNPTTHIENWLRIGDFALVDSGCYLGAFIFGGEYEERLLDKYICDDIITDEMKKHYKSSTLNDEEVKLTPLMSFPKFLLGRGVTPSSVDDLKRHLERHQLGLYGDTIITYDVDISSATTIPEVIRAYKNANKLILIKQAT